MTAIHRFTEHVRPVLRDARQHIAMGDIAGSAATLTYFAAIAIVPWLLFAVWSISWFDDNEQAQQRLLSLRVLIPPDMGARSAYDALIEAGVDVHLLGALVLMFPASFYGEGLRRSTLMMAPGSERFTGWRARGTVLALFVGVPPLALAYVWVGEHLVPLAPEGGGGGPGDLVLRYYLGFLTTWIALSLLLIWVFRFVTPGGPRWWVCAIGAFTTGSFLAGFLQGFAVFLAIPIDVGIPFAGLTLVGGVVAVGLWLWILHMVLIAGWSVTLSIDSRIDSRQEHPEHGGNTLRRES